MIYVLEPQHSKRSGYFLVFQVRGLIAAYHASGRPSQEFLDQLALYSSQAREIEHSFGCCSCPCLNQRDVMVICDSTG